MAKQHRHRKVREHGPYGCAGSVSYIAVCSCGAERETCSCHQCREQGTNDSGWVMPTCSACGLHHPADCSCPAVRS